MTHFCHICTGTGLAPERHSACALKTMPKDALRQIQFGIRAATIASQSKKINEWKDAVKSAGTKKKPLGLG